MDLHALYMQDESRLIVLFHFSFEELNEAVSSLQKHLGDDLQLLRGRVRKEIAPQHGAFHVPLRARGDVVEHRLQHFELDHSGFSAAPDTAASAIEGDAGTLEGSRALPSAGEHASQTSAPTATRRAPDPKPAASLTASIVV